MLLVSSRESPPKVSSAPTTLSLLIASSRKAIVTGNGWLLRSLGGSVILQRCVCVCGVRECVVVVVVVVVDLSVGEGGARASCAAMSE